MCVQPCVRSPMKDSFGDRFIPTRSKAIWHINFEVTPVGCLFTCLTGTIVQIVCYVLILYSFDFYKNSCFQTLKNVALSGTFIKYNAFTVSVT